jgi:hypothetical protein
VHAITIIAIEELKKPTTDTMASFVLNHGFQWPENSMLGVSRIMIEVVRAPEEMNREMLRLGVGQESFTYAHDALSRIHHHKAVQRNANSSSMDQNQSFIDFHRQVAM